MSETPRVAIVGAGPAGLAAAWRLARAGVRVVVYEAAEWVGGRTRTDQVDGYRVDTGAQLFGSMYTRLLGLLDEVGVGERLVRSPGRDALWRDGRAHEVVYGSVASMLASGGLPFRTKMRLGTSYVPFLARHGADLDLHAPERAAAAGLDGESVAAWGAREMDRDFVELLAYPQLAAYYGALPEQTSAGFYHLLARHGVDVTVYALRGGAAVLCEALAERVRRGGGEVRLGVEVREVEVREGGVAVHAGAGGEHFQGAVVAVPAPTARAMVRSAPAPLAEWLAGVRFQPALTLGLLLDRPVGVRYFGLSLPRDAARTVVAACVEENKGGDLVPEGRGLVVAFARPDAAASLVQEDGRRVLDAMLPDLLQALPRLDERVVRARVYRWPTGNPVLYPGYLAHLGAYRSSLPEGEGPLALAGDYLYHASVEGAVTSGQAAAARLLRRLPHPGARPV